MASHAIPATNLWFLRLHSFTRSSPSRTSSPFTANVPYIFAPNHFSSAYCSLIAAIDGVTNRERLVRATYVE
jgi:hypothetical protein